MIGQISLGLIDGSVLYFHPEVTMRNQIEGATVFGLEEKSTKTTIPLLKNNELEYSDFIFWAGDGCS